MIENLVAVAGPRISPSFYRTGGGAEIDLVLTWPDGREWAIEIKRTLSPRPGKGMQFALEDLKPERTFIVYPGEDRYHPAEGIEAISLPDLCAELAAPKLSV